SGKSYKIATEYCNDENRMERLVFHPDYMNTDFVGQIMPTVKDNGDITYLFSPGPFTRIVKKAIANPSEHYYLVIEELNRGNAPGIFGEIFQLLDRSVSGESVYGINNSILATEIYGDKSHQIKIPSNLSLLATMNTADQNVFTLDTAFQRRWTMEMIENDVDLSKYGNYFIADTQYSWKVFNKVINKKILETSSQTLTSEDKRMGAYFISGNVLNIERIRQVPAGDSGKDFNKKNKRFAEKVLKYLWDDAFKFNREDIFDVALYPSLEAIIKRFTDNDNPENGRFDVFAKDIKEELENLREATLIDNNIDTGEEDADSTE
ncbi:TPA: AAA family ATPase, partial [Streptococcus suis]|nr:AAA family ATPase [Streptococcus suis]